MPANDPNKSGGPTPGELIVDPTEEGVERFLKPMGLYRPQPIRPRNSLVASNATGLQVISPLPLLPKRM